MSDVKKVRIFMTGVGGQGTLTATTLLAQTVLAQGLPVTSGEIHGMAQRGGVVESTVLIGCKSPKIGLGEADILIGFEPMETMRALPYLKQGGLVVSSIEFMPPLAVAMGKQECPAIDDIKKAVSACTDKAYYMANQTIGLEAGAVQSGNVAMLGAVCAAGDLPFGPEALEAAIKANLPEKIQAVNLKALELGVAALNA
ncbi:indolepyruvate oxidoreductase subunit beta [Pseudodesulfovibrio portus]|jgi:indolepyruvate ferredoxin oxidoreductase beta subunit|uniref:Indolepyruvate ferredoxin oxidoreductase subunit beta n=1 Tax=Pseudodesulfovibrio portus TaxID=231439 RepID=A0ABN6RZH3_9BACT|nr:indolepyruvate oxidoreductase subunit beta [Pseudodesulfovibrio portus]BDQ35188.1 indolepyruvate ferredoxin oxidoreductase subunit beta [Pseudodesulfovibrio portus]